MTLVEMTVAFLLLGVLFTVLMSAATHLVSYTLNANLVDTSLRHGTDVNSEGQFKGDGIDGTDLTQIGMGTGGGMLIGGLIAGGKGLLIGGAVGATVTVTHWLAKHRSASLPAGTELVMELNRPMMMTSAAGGQ